MLGRFDGRKVRDVPNYRRIMPYLMPKRNESIVFFEQCIDLSRTNPWLQTYNEESEAQVGVFHLVLAALSRVLHERPRLNRFVSGRSIYQRDGVWMSFAAKKSMDDDAPLSMVKRRFPEGESFEDFVDSLQSEVEVARSQRKSPVDKELSLAFKLPAPILGAGVRLLDALDRLNLAPRALLADDPMYASVFVANLGSLKIDAAYHHLYEHGNCPLFVTIGKAEERPVVVDGTVVAREILPLRYSYDERIEDGFYCATSIKRIEELVADPASWCCS